MQDEREKKSEKFLEDPDFYVRSIAHYLNYDSCYKIDGIDASKCARDCDKLANTDFAKKCEKDNGLFKCCIRYIHSMVFYLYRG